MKIERFFVVTNVHKNYTLNDIMSRVHINQFLTIIRAYKTNPIDENITLYTTESEALEDANKRLIKATKNVSEPKRGPGRPKKIQEPQSIKRGPGRPKKIQEPKTLEQKSSKTVKEPSKMNELKIVRQQIESEFMFHIPSYVIRSPGKFEGEMIYMPYYYGVYLEGGADEDNDVIKVEITDEDRIIFPELSKRKKYIKFVITEQGFVQQI